MKKHHGQEMEAKETFQETAVVEIEWHSAYPKKQVK